MVNYNEFKRTTNAVFMILKKYLKSLENSVMCTFVRLF